MCHAKRARCRAFALRSFSLLGIAASVLVDATPADAYELSGGVGLGGMVVGAVPRFAVSPHLGISWRRESGFLFALHDLCSILPPSRKLGVGVYNQTSAAIGYASEKFNFSAGPSISVYSRDQYTEGGGEGAGPIVPTGAGTGDFESEPPREPQSEPPDPDGPVCNAMAEVRCAVPGSSVCVDQCAVIEAYCVHHAVHPYKSTTGVGDLYWCKGGWPSYTCSYQYSNGDNCTLVYPLGRWWCRYDGGKQ